MDLNDFRFDDPGIIADPYPWYEALRRTAPVYRSALLGGAWLISRHGDIRAAFVDPRLSSRRGGYSMIPLAASAPALVGSLTDFFNSWMVFSDRQIGRAHV